jgi:hypothetical protein
MGSSIIECAVFASKETMAVHLSELNDKRHEQTTCPWWLNYQFSVLALRGLTRATSLNWLSTLVNSACNHGHRVGILQR